MSINSTQKIVSILCNYNFIRPHAITKQNRSNHSQRAKPALITEKIIRENCTIISHLC